MQFLHHVAHQAPAPQQVATKLLGELLEARLALARAASWCASGTGVLTVK